ncbi:MAG: hypothetical protein A3F12_07225 [Gammaproteobacteria bacterium RIFCSPHIGHO2_12_FULL_38_14]|nr:MAG: hypothetical protein A3F12_07225 [Gammaproteobacteria bacterium RIFCSPHIGHO2_12_FULL_38_14]
MRSSHQARPKLDLLIEKLSNIPRKELNEILAHFCHFIQDKKLEDFVKFDGFSYGLKLNENLENTRDLVLSANLFFRLITQNTDVKFNTHCVNDEWYIRLLFENETSLEQLAELLNKFQLVVKNNISYDEILFKIFIDAANTKYSFNSVQSAVIHFSKMNEESKIEHCKLFLELFKKENKTYLKEDILVIPFNENILNQADRLRKIIFSAKLLTITNFNDHLNISFGYQLEDNQHFLKLHFEKWELEALSIMLDDLRILANSSYSSDWGNVFKRLGCDQKNGVQQEMDASREKLMNGLKKININRQKSILGRFLTFIIKNTNKFDIEEVDGYIYHYSIFIGVIDKGSDQHKDIVLGIRYFFPIFTGRYDFALEEEEKNNQGHFIHVKFDYPMTFEELQNTFNGLIEKKMPPEQYDSFLKNLAQNIRAPGQTGLFPAPSYPENLMQQRPSKRRR